MFGNGQVHIHFPCSGRPDRAKVVSSVSRIHGDLHSLQNGISRHQHGGTPDPYPEIGAAVITDIISPVYRTLQQDGQTIQSIRNLIPRNSLNSFRREVLCDPVGIRSGSIEIHKNGRGVDLLLA